MSSHTCTCSVSTLAASPSSSTNTLSDTNHSRNYAPISHTSSRGSYVKAMGLFEIPSSQQEAMDSYMVDKYARSSMGSRGTHLLTWHHIHQVWLHDVPTLPQSTLAISCVLAPIKHGGYWSPQHYVNTAKQQHITIWVCIGVISWT